MKCSDGIPVITKPHECNNDLNSTKCISIQGNKYYVDGKYWGEIIEVEDDYFKVKCNNGNRYMKGQISTIYFR